MLLLSWFLVQYDRLFLYRQCYAEALTKEAVFQCDCAARSATTGTDDAASHTTDKSFNKHKLEEPFTGSRAQLADKLPAPEPGYPIPACASIPTGHARAIFQPPRI